MILAVTFGDERAIERMKATAADHSADTEARTAAIVAAEVATAAEDARRKAVAEAKAGGDDAALDGLRSSLVGEIRSEYRRLEQICNR